MEMAVSIGKIAEYDSKACRRCGNPIRKGESRVESVKFPGNPIKIWCHVGCKAAGQRDNDEYGENDPTDAIRPKPSTPAAPVGDRPTPGLSTAGGISGTTTSAGIDEYAVRKTIKDFVAEATAGLEGAVATNVQKLLETPLLQMIRKGIESGVKDIVKFAEPRIIEVRKPDGTTFKLENEVLLERFGRVKELVECRQDIYMPGPTGAGKSHLAAQTARVLGMPFGLISCSKGMSEGQIVGRLIPQGKMGQFEYLPTIAVSVYENGGLFLWDEIDAADANTLLAINSALANGIMSLPNRNTLPEGVTLEEFLAEAKTYDWKSGTPFKYRGYGPIAFRNPDYVAIAAANTVGTGGDRQYVGRDPLDLSTIDRFLIGYVMVDYSPKIERHLCPDKDLLKLLWTWRGRINASAGAVRRVMSTRFIAKAYEMKVKAKWDAKRTAEAFFAGWSEDEVQMVYGKKSDWNYGENADIDWAELADEM
jgi:hypothetical protein